MKALLIVCAVLTLGLVVSGKLLLNEKERTGELSASLAQATQIAADNERVFAAAIEAKNAEIKQLQQARELSDKVVAASLAREKDALARISGVERTLREAIANEQESAAWAAVRVPDSVIDGMHRAAGVAGGSPSR